MSASRNPRSLALGPVAVLALGLFIGLFGVALGAAMTGAAAWRRHWPLAFMFGVVTLLLIARIAVQELASPGASTSPV